MGELLRRGLDAQIADRNTKGYDLLVGRAEDPTLRKVQVKTVRAPPWYVNTTHFQGDLLDQVTVYVLLGKEDGNGPVRYFIAKNIDVAAHVHLPKGWSDNGFISLKAVSDHEFNWDALLA